MATEKMAPIVTVEDLSVTYPGQKHTAIEGVSFEIYPGSITTLLGPNGAGKSTVIKAILGLIPYKGKIHVFGRAVHEVYTEIGYVPQFKNFDASFPMSVQEFIDLSLAGVKHDDDWQEKRVDSVMKAIDSVNLLHRPISNLSGGQLQRILLARALVHKPKVIILDEPEAGIDVGAEQTFYEIIKRLTEEDNVTVIIASHELDVVYNFADRVICINHQMMCDGPPKTALSQDIFEKLYGREIKLYGHSHSKHHHG